MIDGCSYIADKEDAGYIDQKTANGNEVMPRTSVSAMT